jgi:hypothetical protein
MGMSMKGAKEGKKKKTKKTWKKKTQRGNLE